MALARRSGQRFQASIWPGFVDAMTGLLLVLMFVLSIFMIVQFVLRETITGQEDALNVLAGEVAVLAQALGLEEQQTDVLDAQLGELRSTLAVTEQSLAQRSAELENATDRIASLVAQRDAQNAALSEAQAQITDFEMQVAALLLEQRTALARVSELEAQNTQFAAEQDRLNTALAQARNEVDVSAEQARLAASRRAALEALIADLRSRNADAQGTIIGLQSELSRAENALSEEEAARIAEAAAADLLRARLAEADTELTAMTLALENQRQEAEDTLTLLAAARALNDDLNAELGAALTAIEQSPVRELQQENATLQRELAAALAARRTDQEALVNAQETADQREILLASVQSALAEEETKSLTALRETELLNQQVSALRQQLGRLQSLLSDAQAREVEQDLALDTLGQDLNAALAQVAIEERRRRELEERERARLEAVARELETEAQELERYRSEFFGQLRDILSAQDGVRIVGDRFVFSSEVLFEPARAELSAVGQDEIASVAAVLLEVAQDIPDGVNWVLQVDGHTDDVPLSGQGQFADNWELSQARALSVVRFMINDLGIPPTRLSANGFGQYQPINTADTAEARAQNRRIELKLTEK